MKIMLKIINIILSPGDEKIFVIVMSGIITGVGERDTIQTHFHSSQVIMINCIRCHTQLNTEFLKTDYGIRPYSPCRALLLTICGNTVVIISDLLPQLSYFPMCFSYPRQNNYICILFSQSHSRLYKT